MTIVATASPARISLGIFLVVVAAAVVFIVLRTIQRQRRDRGPGDPPE